MTLHPGAWVGLPAGALEAESGVALLRVVLLLLALATGALVARGALRSAAACAVGLAACALGFWLGCLGRPYGLLLDRERTLALCELSQAHARGSSDTTCVLGEPGVAPLHRGLGAGSAALGVPADLALSLPSLLPLAAFLLVGALLHLWARARPGARLAVFVWFAVSATQLDLVAPEGGLLRLWRSPFSLALLLPALVLYLAVVRRTSSTLAAGLAAAAAGAAAGLLGEGASEVTPALALRISWLAPGLWAVLGWAGALRNADRAALGLLLGGLALLALGSAGAPLDLHVSHLWYRLGIVLGVASLLGELVQRSAGASEAAAVAPLSRVLRAPRWLEGGLVALLLSGSPLAWWNPLRLDRVASASTSEESERLLRATRWVREHTAAEAVFLASPSYAPAVGVLAGRRVFQAPSLLPSRDDARRGAIVSRLLNEGLERQAAGHLGLTHVFAGPGDQSGERPWLPRTPSTALRLLHSDRWGFRVYEIEARPAAASRESGASRPPRDP